MEKAVIQFVFVHFGLLVFICFNSVTTEGDLPQRNEGKAIPSKYKIYKRAVHCSQDPPIGKFPSQTYSCKDMRVTNSLDPDETACYAASHQDPNCLQRVDGMRMAYGYHKDIMKNDGCNETDGFDEIAEVCRSLMRALGSTKKLWAAAVTNATCGYINEPRVLLNMTRNGGFRWDKMKPGFGWVETLQCMALKDRSGL